jgi:N-acetyl-anhydromuramyl-L-alanine amidase AmpD
MRIKKKKLKFMNKKNIEKLFFKNLYKIGYRYFSIHKRSNKDRHVIQSFQQRFLPKSVSGKIDQKTYKISHFLAN